MNVWSAVKDTATRVIMWGNAHSAALYTSTGIVSGFGAVVSGIWVTIENTRKIDNEKAERERFGEPPMTTLDVIKLVGPSYIPCLLLFGTSAACFILNVIKEERRIATLAGLYSMSEKSFEEYRKKVEEMFGRKKEQKVRDEVATDQAQKALAQPHTVIMTGNGSYPCLDAWSNTIFYSTQQDIEKARINVRDRVRDDMYISLAEVYDEMDLPLRRKDDGSTMVDYSAIGWTYEDGLDFYYTYCAGNNGEPMMVVSFMPPPHEDYNRLY